MKCSRAASRITRSTPPATMSDWWNWRPAMARRSPAMTTQPPSMSRKRSATASPSPNSRPPSSAAAALHAAGIKVMMGAPNLIRGGSHSGNVAAAELARAGMLDLMSSDYVPSSLLMAALRLPAESDKYDLPAAVRTVSKTAAEAVGLTDRGEIAIGKRADLIQVHQARRCCRRARRLERRPARRMIGARGPGASSWSSGRAAPARTRSSLAQRRPAPAIRPSCFRAASSPARHLPPKTTTRSTMQLSTRAAAGWWLGLLVAGAWPEIRHTGQHR